MNLRGVIIIHSCFCFTLRTMFNSSFEGGGGGGGGGGEFNLFIFFQKSNFCICLPILVIPLFI